MSKREKISFERALEFIQRFGYSVHRRLARRRGDEYPVYVFKDPPPKGMEKHYELEEWLGDERYNILYEAYKRLREESKARACKFEQRIPKAKEMPISEELVEQQPELKEILERCMILERELGEEEKYLDYETTKRNLLSEEETLKKRVQEKREERKRLEREKIIEWFYETVKREFPFLFCPKCGVPTRFMEIGDNIYRANYQLWFSLYGPDFIRDKGLVLTAFKCPKCGLEGFVRCRQCEAGQLYMSFRYNSLSLARVRCNVCEIEHDVCKILREEYKKSWGKSFLERIWNDEDTSAYDILNEECKKLWKEGK